MKFIIFIFLGITLHAQNMISGLIKSENGFVVRNVIVVNVTTGYKTMSDINGNFQIAAKVHDELRFVKKNYERKSKVIKNDDIENHFEIQLILIPTEIEEVKIEAKPTGNLEYDISKIKVDSSKEELKKVIGLPEPKGVQREKVPTVLNNVILPLFSGILNVDAIYKLVSGDAKKMKSLYKYEDTQRDVNWILERNGIEYFCDKGIPKERVTEFIEFSLTTNAKIHQSIKDNKIGEVNIILEELLPTYHKRLIR